MAYNIGNARSMGYIVPDAGTDLIKAWPAAWQTNLLKLLERIDSQGDFYGDLAKMAADQYVAASETKLTTLLGQAVAVSVDPPPVDTEADLPGGGALWLRPASATVSTPGLYLRYSGTAEWVPLITYSKDVTSVAGPRGPKGDQGPKGEKGPKGDDGKTGPAGRTASVLTPSATGWVYHGPGVLYSPLSDGTYYATLVGTLTRSAANLASGSGWVTIAEKLIPAANAGDGEGLANIDGTSYGANINGNGDFRLWFGSARGVNKGTGVQVTAAWIATKAP